jgi:hypothetical protein
LPSPGIGQVVVMNCIQKGMQERTNRRFSCILEYHSSRWKTLQGSWRAVKNWDAQGMTSFKQSTFMKTRILDKWLMPSGLSHGTLPKLAAIYR